jgi:ankyrin repeat protein
MLLDRGADPDFPEPGMPLIAALGHGHGKVVQMLLDQGADVNARSSDQGATPLFVASYSGHEKIVQVLLD